MDCFALLSGSLRDALARLPGRIAEVTRYFLRLGYSSS
jgi:hypothetical protein